MANLSKVILCGRLTRDPELRYTTGGTAVTTLSLAVNRRFKKGDNWEEEVSFFNVVLFGRRAETTAEYMSKGREILVEGDLVQRRWETSDGQKRSTVEILANQVEWLGGKGDKQPHKDLEPATKPNGGTQNDGPPPVDDDDIPF
jgi:single-strand DNA-binding protein